LVNTFTKVKCLEHIICELKIKNLVPHQVIEYIVYIFKTNANECSEVLFKTLNNKFL
jgi:hypothetical protein